MHPAVLFLGADVLATSRQPVNHHARIHSRYAKLGLATKVTMNGLFLAFALIVIVQSVDDMCIVHCCWPQWPWAVLSSYQSGYGF